jgi:ligand-binding sensor domain-containing protein
MVGLVLAAVRPARAEAPVEVRTSTDDVRACAVAEQGIVLAGTTGGLVVVGQDGQAREVTTSLDGLPDTRVHALLVEGATVWIGTERGLTKGNLHGVHVSIDVSYPAPAVRAIRRHGGDIYAGTWGGGVMHLVGSKLERVPFADGTSPAKTGARTKTDAGGPERARVTALASFGDALYATTAGAGLFRMDRLDRAGFAPVGGSRVPRMGWALAVHQDRLWVGGLEGVASIGKDAPWRPELDADTRAFADVGDALLAGTYGKGVLRIAGRSATPDGDAPPFVQALDARGGARCVGARDGLVVRGGRVASSGMPDNDVTAIATDGDRLWVGTYDRGVGVLEDGHFRRETRADGRVNAMAIEARRAGGSRVWIATARGLTMIDGDAARTFGGGGVLPSSAVHAVTALSSGGVLVGTERGAAILRDGVVTRIDDKQGVPLRAVWAVAEGPGGMLLLGSSAGLYYGSLGGPWQKASVAGGHLLDDWVTSLAVRGDDVYVGTYNAGVTRLALDGGKLVLGEHLHGGYVNLAGVAVFGNTLYAATMDGLVARPLAGGSTRPAIPGGGWRMLSRASTGKDVTGIVASGADLWVASRRGLVRVRP